MSLALDGTAKHETAAFASSATVTLTTGSAGDIIVVEIWLVNAQSSSTNYPNISSVSDGTNTYTRRSRRTMQISPANFAAAYEVWWAYAPAALSSKVITASLQAGTGGDATNNTNNFDQICINAFGVKGFAGTGYQTAPWDTNASVPAYHVYNGTSAVVPRVDNLYTTGADSMLLSGFGGAAIYNYPADMSDPTNPASFSHIQNAMNPNGNYLYWSQITSYLVVSSAQSNISIYGAKASQTAQDGFIFYTDALFMGTAGGATQALTPSLVTNTQTFFAPKVGLSSPNRTYVLATPAGALAISEFGTQDFVDYGAQIVQTPYVPPSLGQSLTSSLYTDPDTFFAPTVAVGAVTLAPALFTDPDTFFTPTITQGAGLQTLTPALFTNTQTFFTPVLLSSYTLAPPLYTNSQTFFAPTVGRGAVALTPALYTNTQNFFTPVITTGAVGLAPSLYTNTNSFFGPTISVGAVNVSPSLFTNTQSFFSPTITVGAVAITPALFTNAQTFFSPLVSSGGIAVAPNLFTNTQTFPSPTVGRGAVNLAPGLYTNTQSFFVPVVSAGTTVLAPTLFTDPDSFFAATVVPGSTNLSVGLFTNVQNYFSPAVVLGAANIAPALYTNTQTFFTPVVGGVATIAPAPYVDPDVFFGPTIGVGGVVVAPPLVPSSTFFLGATVSSGGVVVGGGGQALNNPFIASVGAMMVR